MATVKQTTHDKLEQIRKHILTAMDRHPTLTLRDHLTTAEHSVGYSRAWLLLGVVQMTILTLWLIGGLPFIGKLVGFVYPAYSSFKAIDTPSQKSSEMWLTYWIVFAFVGVIEPVAWPLLQLIPFYQLVKIGFLMWCYNPSTQGASVLYAQVIRPYVLPNIGIATNTSTTTSSSSSSTAALRSRPPAAGSSTSSKAAVVESDEASDAAAAAAAPSTPAAAGKEEAEIIARVVSASGLPAMEADRTDAYVLLSAQRGDGTLLSSKCKTKTKPSATEPKWSEELRLHLQSSSSSDTEGAVVVAQVFHKTGFGLDTPIGRVTIDLSTLAGGEEVSGEYPLEDPQKENPVGVAGSLRLALRLAQ